jgi:hypothetical protein
MLLPARSAAAGRLSSTKKLLPGTHCTSGLSASHQPLLPYSDSQGICPQGSLCPVALVLGWQLISGRPVFTGGVPHGDPAGALTRPYLPAQLRSGGVRASHAPAAAAARPLASRPSALV